MGTRWVIAASIFGWAMFATLSLGLVLGVAHDAAVANQADDGPKLTGVMLAGHVTGSKLDLGAVPQAECAGALHRDALAPGLVYDVGRTRSTPITLGFEVDEDMPPIDWAVVSNWTRYYYAVDVGPVADGGIDLKWRPTHGSATVDDDGGTKAGNVHYLVIHNRDGSVLNRFYSVDVYKADHIEYTLLHEIGHALGLDHALNEGNIMQPVLEGGMGLIDCQRTILGHVHQA